MNRELKFRVWDFGVKKFLFPKNKCYLNSDSGYPSLAFDLSNSGNYFTFFNSAVDFSKQYQIQQFTSLKDIKGREIYEGDLVNFHTPGRPHGPEREDFTYEEVWFDENSASFVFGKIYYDGWHGYGTWDVKDLEVVGNVFESPDKVKKYENNH